jgi:uncharacterized Ntn-hydrolase superfamily protein
MLPARAPPDDRRHRTAVGAVVTSTVSIAARCPATGQLGVAAVTAVLGVGKLVPHAEAGTGAVATQALANPYHALDGLRLMRQGLSASDALSTVIAADPERESRQTAMIDGRGATAAWTGAATLPWAGHVSRAGVTVQGNRLVGPGVLDAMLRAWDGTGAQTALVRRLLGALEAGEAAGADREGALSAALVVVDTEWYPLWDLRIDHADDPVAELRALFEVSQRDLLPHVLDLPKRADRVCLAPTGGTAGTSAGSAAIAP